MPLRLTTSALTDPQDSAAVERARKLRDILIIAAMLIVITALHTFTNPATSPDYHDFYRRLYYIPILYAAFVFGVRGGLLTAISAAFLYAPFAQPGADKLFGLVLDDWLELVMFLVMGVLFGRLRDLEEKQTREVRSVSARLEDAYRSLEERAVQLKTAQGYSQSILRSVTSGVLTVGPDTSVATLNPAAERILGISEDVIVARPLQSAFKDDGGLTQDVRKVLEGRSPRTLRDIKVVTTGGKVVHAQASVSRMRDIGGRKLGAVVTLEDVSDIKALTDQLIRADRLAAMGELTAGVAHEVRNPLGVIRASVQLLEDAEAARRASRGRSRSSSRRSTGWTASSRRCWTSAVRANRRCVPVDGQRGARGCRAVHARDSRPNPRRHRDEHSRRTCPTSWRSRPTQAGVPEPRDERGAGDGDGGGTLTIETTGEAVRRGQGSPTRSRASPRRC
jgi:PAS domain S-box-containing protein